MAKINATTVVAVSGMDFLAQIGAKELSGSTPFYAPIGEQRVFPVGGNVKVVKSSKDGESWFNLMIGAFAVPLGKGVSESKDSYTVGKLEATRDYMETSKGFQKVFAY